MPTTMWEVRAADGQLEALITWVLIRVGAGTQVYRSVGGDPRLVVIDPSGCATGTLADPPPDMVAGVPHAWDFEPVSNQSGQRPILTTKQ